MEQEGEIIDIPHALCEFTDVVLREQSLDFLSCFWILYVGTIDWTEDKFGW